MCVSLMSEENHQVHASHLLNPLRALPVLLWGLGSYIFVSQTSVAGELQPMGGAGIGGREQGEARVSLLLLSLCFRWCLQQQPCFPPGLACGRSSVPLCGQAGTAQWSSFRLRAQGVILTPCYKHLSCLIVSCLTSQVTHHQCSSCALFIALCDTPRVLSNQWFPGWALIDTVSINRLHASVSIKSL